MKGAVNFTHVLSTLTFFIAADVLKQKMNLSYTPKFHMLHDHVPEIIIQMNGFFEMGEDTIER